jgi:NodT family efflux transporter outer membrane factor (OMF) lipoprotein
MRFFGLLALCLGGLAACATRPPGPEPVDQLAPAQWHVALPHEDGPILLAYWWREPGDALLVELIESAQAASPTIASAMARIAEARASRVAAGAALAPTLDGSLTISRDNSMAASLPSAMGITIPPMATSQAALQAGWEIDLFGGAHATRDAAQAQFEGAQARWHAARISVAADTTLMYYDERACQRQALVLASDARSRAETARLTGLAADAGFQAPADAQRARASASDGNSRLTQQHTACTVLRKALVALTGLDAAALDAKLDAATIDPPLPTLNSINSVPAQALAQRPDLYAAERAVAAASAQAGAAQAQRYPRLSLQGFISRVESRGGGFSQGLDTWSLGPLTLTLPIFDGGRRAAEADAARARYDEAVSQYRASVRQAVREVEEALVTLHSADARTADAQSAAANFEQAFTATQARYSAGMASLFELEDARRTLLAAQIALTGLQRDRAEALVALYRAMGGGWLP